MQIPLFVRPLTADERATVETGLRSSSAGTVRRCQRLLASAEGQSTTTMAHDRRGTAQTVRQAMQALHPRGRAVLQPLSSRPHTIAPLFEAGACESLRALWHHRPRTFDTPTSRWPLALAAAVRGAQGLTPRLGSDDTRRVALRRLRVAWTRATPWLPRPAPASARTNNGATHCSRGPGPSRRGAWGGATQAGGVGWPSLPNLAGRRQKPRTSSRSCPPRQPIPIPRRSPGMAGGVGRSRRRRLSRGGSGV